MGFRKCALTLIVFFPLFAFSQNQDSLQQVMYKQALKKFADKDWAETRYVCHEWKEASADFEKLLSADRSDTELYQKIGIAQYNAGEWKAACVALDKVVKKGVKDKEVFVCWP